MVKKKIEVYSIFTTLLANRANIGFTTGGHTGEDVFYIHTTSKASWFDSKHGRCKDNSESDGL